MENSKEMSQVSENEENTSEEMDQHVEKEIETLVIPDSPTEEIDQDMDEEENLYKNMNEELDKQIAKDMEAIRNYINRTDDSLKSRIEFFNNIDNSHINKCIDKTVTNHILVQHTFMGTISWHECTQCDYKAKERHKLRDHIIEKHTDTSNDSWLLCHRCTFVARRKTDLDNHLRQRHGENPEPSLRCDKCDEKFFREKELFAHKKEDHNETIFVCENCDYETLDESDLKQHKMTHLKLNFSWYKCAQCSYRTVRKANLDRHIMYKHSVF